MRSVRHFIETWLVRSFRIRDGFPPCLAFQNITLFVTGPFLPYPSNVPAHWTLLDARLAQPFLHRNTRAATALRVKGSLCSMAPAPSTTAAAAAADSSRPTGGIEGRPSLSISTHSHSADQQGSSVTGGGVVHHYEEQLLPPLAGTTPRHLRSQSMAERSSSTSSQHASPTSPPSASGAAAASGGAAGGGGGAAAGDTGGGLGANDLVRRHHTLSTSSSRLVRLERSRARLAL